jgi:hypothetical protein
VTLLPRHWEWLNAQPGGASAALRRLVDVGRIANAGRDRRRRAQEYAYRFLVAMLGDAPGFEHATRALFAGDQERFIELSEPWPDDPRDHARRSRTVSINSFRQIFTILLNIIIHSLKVPRTGEGARH